MLKTDKNSDDLIFILNNLRREDLEEVTLVYGSEWKNKVIENTVNTDFMVLSVNSIPVAVGGLVPNTNNPRIACVWLLCSKYIKEHKITLLKELKSQVNKSYIKFDILYNHIYKSNFEAKKWLKKLGFKFDNPHPDGFSLGADFEFFYKINN